MGSVLERGAPGYETARCAAVANGRVPERYPAVIVQADGDEDVVAAIALAQQRGLRVTVRSGGHSWSGSHLRDDCLLIDLSSMTRVEVDAEAMTAVVEPGIRGSDLSRLLSEHDLFFPTGHCTGPGIGGFILQGGFGWNSRAIGPACMSLDAVDLVTADGELVRASATENEDLFWAARGAGPGFFAVAVRFHVRLARRPAVCMANVYLYPVEVIEELMSWAREVGARTPRTMEFMVFLRRDLFGYDGPVLMVNGPVLADSHEQAVEDSRILESCPLLDSVLDAPAPRYAVTDVDQLVGESDDFYPPGSRFVVDNMWTSATTEELLPGLRRIAETLPASPSHMMWMHWGAPEPPRPDMAYSLEDEVYIALYGVSGSPDDDAGHTEWVTSRMREMEHLASGIQLADENLARRPMPFLAPENLRRLQEIRAQRDPAALFHEWMRPGESRG